MDKLSNEQMEQMNAANIRFVKQTKEFASLDDLEEGLTKAINEWAATIYSAVGPGADPPIFEIQMNTGGEFPATGVRLTNSGHIISLLAKNQVAIGMIEASKAGEYPLHNIVEAMGSRLSGKPYHRSDRPLTP